MNTNNIKTIHDFIAFLNEYSADYKNNPENWENNHLGKYLAAMASYTEDIDGYYQNTNQKINLDVPSYKIFADILMGAKIYE